MSIGVAAGEGKVTITIDNEDDAIWLIMDGLRVEEGRQLVSELFDAMDKVWPESDYDS